VYSPQGADVYPAPIWDKATGVIDKARRRRIALHLRGKKAMV
jgi:hypothetical protein